MEFVLCWPTRHGVCLVYGWYAQRHSVSENWFSLPQQVSIADSFSVRGGTLHPLASLSSGLWSGLNLCVSYACCYHLCELIRASVMWSLDDSGSLALSIRHLWLLQLSTPLSYRSLGLQGRGLIKTSYLGRSAPKSLTLNFVQVRVSVFVAISSEKFLWWGLNDALICGYSITFIAISP